jgi:excisionase family DNA binding protein
MNSRTDGRASPTQAAQVVPIAHDRAHVDSLERRGYYLLVEEVAERLRCSVRTIHELTRTNAIPHRRLPGTRRCLFRLDELEAWEDGVPLEVTELPRGGRLVVPRRAAA